MNSRSNIYNHIHGCFRQVLFHTKDSHKISLFLRVLPQKICKFVLFFRCFFFECVLGAVHKLRDHDLGQKRVCTHVTERDQNWTI